MYNRPVSLRMPSPLQARVISAAEKKASIADSNVTLFWPGHSGAITESRSEALLRSMDHAARCVLMAEQNRALSTKLRVLKKLDALSGSLKRVRKNFDAVLADDLAHLELHDAANRMAASKGHPLFPPNVIPSSSGADFISHRSEEFFEHFGAALEQVSRIAQSASHLDGESQPIAAPVTRTKGEGVILAAMGETAPKNAALRMIYFAWVYALNRKATATVDVHTGKHGGIFLDFAAEMLTILRFRMNPGQIRARFRRMGYMS